MATEAPRFLEPFPIKADFSNMKAIDDGAPRIDMSSSPILTIDSPSTVEVDDGLSYEKKSDGSEWVHVHIADPTRFFPCHSEMDLAVSLIMCCVT